MTVGSGVGPYYGLYSPDAMLQETAGVAPFPEDGLPPPEPAKEFAIRRQDVIELEHRITEGSGLDLHPKQLAMRWLCSDLLSRLSVLDSPRRASGILAFKTRVDLPALPSPPTLIQWYVGWLERVEADLTEYRAPSIVTRLRKRFRG
jgi:hypothetical protein